MVFAAISYFFLLPASAQNGQTSRRNKNLLTEYPPIENVKTENIENNTQNPKIDSEASPKEAEKKEITRILSLDFSFLRFGIQNNGWGIGIRYEHRFFPHFSFSGGFSHTTVETNLDDLYCTTVGLLFLANWYPFSKDLRYAYIGIGSGIDFLNYFGKNVEEEASHSSVLSCVYRLGVRFPLPLPRIRFFARRCLIDLFIGWKQLFYADGLLYGSVSSYVKNGFQCGCSVKKYF